jgi:uncharacterized protein
MLDLATGYFRKSVFKTYRFLKHPRRLKKNAFLRWFSRHFLNKRVWKPCQHTVAGGMAVGCFVTLQLFPGQMPLAIFLAAAFRVNIPVALAVCWISNPATFVPIGMFEKHVGEWLLGFVGDPSAAWLASMENQSIAKGLAYARYMYLGGLVGGAILAPIGYVVTYAIWGLVVRFTPHPVVRTPIAAAAAPSSEASAAQPAKSAPVPPLQPIE